MTERKEIRFFDLAAIGNSALHAAFHVHQTLGERGLDPVQKNAHGDQALRVDVESEAAVIAALRENGLPIELMSEEHGRVLMAENPRFFGTLDGLDGTGVYRETRGVGKYGTMFSIYSTTDPSYADYQYGGIFIHSQQQLLYAERGRGAYAVIDGQKTKLAVSKKDMLDEQTRIGADLNCDRVYNLDVLTTRIHRNFADHNVTTTMSFAADFAELVSGEKDGVIGYSRKGDLEIAAAYPLIIEAGGVVIDINGRPLGEQRYHEFQQPPYTIFIAAASLPLAEAIRQKLLQQ